MLETNASPDEVVSWYRSDQCRDEVLVIWVSGERRHGQLLRKLLDEAPDLDTVLQDKVAFLFSSPDGAALVRPGGLAGAPFFRRLNRPGASRAPAVNGRLTRATLDAAGDFATEFDLGPSEAPALVILVKDLPEHVVAPMGPAVALGDIRPWLAAIVGSARAHRRRCAELGEDPVWDGPSLQKLRDAGATVEARRRAIREAVEGLSRSNPDASAQMAPLAALVVKAVALDPTECMNAIAQQKQHAAADGFKRLLRDGRIGKLEKLLSGLEGLQQDVGAMLTRRVALQEQHDRYQKSVAQLEADIRAIAKELGGGRMARLRSTAAAALNSAPRFLTKAVRVIKALEDAYKMFASGAPP